METPKVKKWMPPNEHGCSPNGELCDPRPMTPAEKRWVAELEAILLRCPPGLELATTGDQSLTVLDKAKSHLSFEDGIGDLNGVNIGRVRAGCRIHGISG
jgi:hypothetical protein